VPRHIFVEDALTIRAYDDSPLPIGAGQTTRLDLSIDTGIR